MRFSKRCRLPLTFAICLLFSLMRAEAAITFGSVTTAADYTGLAQTLQFSETIAPDPTSNTILVLDVWSSTTEDITATYAGIPMTVIGHADEPKYNGYRTTMLYLLFPPSGTNPIVVSQPLQNRIAAAARTYMGVNHSNPIGQSVTGWSDAQSVAPTLSVTVASAPGELVIDSVVNYTNGLATPAALADPSQTVRYDNTRPSGAGFQFNRFEGSDKPGATSVTMQWINNGSYYGMAMLAVPLKPAPVTTTTATGTTAAKSTTASQVCGPSLFFGGCDDASRIVVKNNCIPSSNNTCTPTVPTFTFTMTLVTESTQLAAGLNPGDVVPYQSILNSFKELAGAAQNDGNIAGILGKYGIAIYGSDGTQIFPMTSSSVSQACGPSSICPDVSRIVVTGTCNPSPNSTCSTDVPSFTFTMTVLNETTQLGPGLGPGDVIPYQAIVNSYQDLAVAAQSDSNIAGILQKYGIAVFASDGTAIVPQLQ